MVTRSITRDQRVVIRYKHVACKVAELDKRRVGRMTPLGAGVTTLSQWHVGGIAVSGRDKADMRRVASRICA